MKTNFLLRSIIILAATAVIFSCKKSKSDNPNTTEEIKAGTKWVFKVSELNEAGTVISSNNYTLVASAQTFAGSSWFVLTEQTTSTPVIAIQKRSDGWWQLPLPYTTASLWYKTNAAVNDTYNITISDGTTDVAKVTSITASVTVPAGTYNNCTKVESHDTNSLENEYWFTGSGPIVVKITEYDEKAAGPASNIYMAQLWELVSFTK
ncbi:MAG: hypothetical protein EKK37_07950 [Sphingobacteriales bacterium]|nr:MAG: hypothetical protein EKK37_07950 [Sphingobacteriales bacterium]